LEKGKERLDKALEEIALLCEPVEPPKDQMAYLRYFCGNPENEDDLKNTETRRTFLYKDTVALIRAYANIAAELEEAGYSQPEIADIKKKVDFYLNLREEIKNASGETLDMKTYEADMRHLIDTYIQAEVPRTISPFADMSLLDIIVNSGIAAAIMSLPAGIKSNKEAVAEAIINNVRKKIIKEHLIDPAYFEEMSKLLDEIIKERKANAISYEEYLRKIADLSKKVTQTSRDDLPGGIQTAAQRALYNNTGKNEALAIKLDAAVKQIKKADWRGNIAKENEIKHNLNEILKDQVEVERLFAIIKQQSEY
jgi:type I restriction enzyme R subunit